MNYNPEILVSPINLEEMKLLADAGADAFVVGDSRFALCARGSFTKSELEDAVSYAKTSNKKVYLLIDAIFPNALLSELEIYLTEVADIAFDGIRLADPGALMLAKAILPSIEIQLVDAMMLTNYFTVNYWAKKGVKRGRIAYELTLEEVQEIKKSANCQAEVLIQGAPLMFTSRRRLVENYLDFKRTIGKDITLSTKSNHLFDEERNLYYPIVENEHGTHIYGGSDVCMIDALDEFASVGLDALYIEGFTYETQDLVKIVELYKTAIQLLNDDPSKYAQAGPILYAEVEKYKSSKRQLDRGFYYKPTIYKNKSAN